MNLLSCVTALKNDVTGQGFQCHIGAVLEKDLQHGKCPTCSRKRAVSRCSWLSLEFEHYVIWVPTRLLPFEMGPLAAAISSHPKLQSLQGCQFLPNRKSTPGPSPVQHIATSKMTTFAMTARFLDLRKDIFLPGFRSQKSAPIFRNPTEAVEDFQPTMEEFFDICSCWAISVNAISWANFGFLIMPIILGSFSMNGYVGFGQSTFSQKNSETLEL